MPLLTSLSCEGIYPLHISPLLMASSNVTPTLIVILLTTFTRSTPIWSTVQFDDVRVINQLNSVPIAVSLVSATSSIHLPAPCSASDARPQLTGPVHSIF